LKRRARKKKKEKRGVFFFFLLVVCFGSFPQIREKKVQIITQKKTGWGEEKKTLERFFFLFHGKSNDFKPKKIEQKKRVAGGAWGRGGGTDQLSNVATSQTKDKAREFGVWPF
jgi:hypothetical protein